jgi:hypothetical protein
MGLCKNIKAETKKEENSTTPLRYVIRAVKKGDRQILQNKSTYPWIVLFFQLLTDIARFCTGFLSCTVGGAGTSRLIACATSNIASFSPAS